MDSDPPPPYEALSGSVNDDNDNVNVNVNDYDSDYETDDDDDVNWARNHLLEARTALASYHDASRALKRQVFEEQEVIRRGIEHHGPPPAHTPRTIVPTWKNGATLENKVPTSSVFGPGNIEAQLDDAIRYGAFGYNNLMPGLPRRRDPLRDAFKGVQTMAVRNPSVQWGAMVPRQHFPGAEVEGIIPEMESTPEYVILRRHVCGTECPFGCHQGGGVRKKEKGRATAEVGDVEGGEAMEGVVYAHWGDDDFDESEDSGSDHVRQEKLRLQQELETIESLDHCTTIERHRRKWAAEIGALTYKARIITEKLPLISINTVEPEPKEELDEPEFCLVGKMAKRLEDRKATAERLKREKARLARIRIGKWRARMAGRDTTQMGDEAGEAVFQSLVDSGGINAPENDSESEWADCSSEGSSNGGGGDGAPRGVSRSPDKEDTAIDDSPESSAVTENTTTSDSDLAKAPRGSHPTVKSTEEAVSDLVDEETNLRETASQKDVPEEIRNLEAKSEETAAEESIAQALIAQAAIVRDATSTDPTLEETPITESAPQETTSGEAAPDDTTLETTVPKEAAREYNTTEKATTEETSAQETLGPGPGPSRKRPAPKKSSLTRRPAKRQSIRESPFLDPSEQEKPPVWILQRDGRLIRNPLADAHSGPQAGRRWSDPHIDAPVPIPPSDSELRPRSATISEGMEPPVPRCSANELPRIGGEGQITEHVEVVGESPAPPSPTERSLADRESMTPPPRPRPRHRSLAVSEGSPNLVRLWSSDDMFPSIERLSQAVQQSLSGGNSAADVTSLAPARASTPEPRQMSREEIRRSARTLATLLEAAEQRLEDPDFGFIIVMTEPRVAESAIPHRPTRGPSALRREYLIDEEALEAEESDRLALEVGGLERSEFASRVPNPPRYNLRSRSRASTDNPSPVTPSVFSSEMSGRSSEATSVTATPTRLGDLTGQQVGASEAADSGGGERVAEGEHLPSIAALAANRRVTDEDGIPGGEGSEGREASLWREGSAGTEGSMGREGSAGREGSMESEGSIGRERSVGRDGSITAEVAESLGGLVVESGGDMVGEESEVDEGAGVFGRVLPLTEVPEEAIEDNGDGAPLTRVPSHTSTRSL